MELDLIALDFRNSFETCAKSLQPGLLYHNAAHSREVRDISLRWATAEGLDSAHDRLLIEIAALYHDLGFLKCYEQNEIIGARMALDKMKTFSFSDQDCQCVHDMIMATQMPQNPKTLMEKILCDADLDNLGRSDFMKNTDALYLERQHFGYQESKLAWYRDAYKLVSKHQFHTHAARSLRDDQKNLNASLLQQLIDETP